MLCFSVSYPEAHVEDINLLVPELSQCPQQKAPSADTVLRTLKKLSVDDELVKAKGVWNKLHIQPQFKAE